MTTWNWNGARWWKCDLHAHTPKSDDYGNGSDQAALKARTAKDWLLDQMRAGLDCVAVTDHNSGEWIDDLTGAEATLAQTKHADYRKLYIFPGVELSVNGGFHVLVILDPTKTGHDISGLIRACGYRGTFGKCEAVTDKTFSQVVEEVVKLGGIVIPAHVDEPTKKGLWRLQDHNTWQQVLCSKHVAWEIVDPTKAKPDVVTRHGGTFAEVLGSDSHKPTEVGGKFSWVKMTTPTLEGLRLALMDGSLSVLRSDQHVDNPNDNLPGLAVECLEVENAKYIGRSEGTDKKPFRVVFNPWLNTIIGGRGTGKSSLLEFIRIALRRDRELEKHEKINDEFQRYITPGEKGLLMSNTILRVIYRKDGVRFRIQWDISGETRPLEEETENGEWRTAIGEVASRFPASIYSQKQLYAMADDPSALLAKIDESTEVDIRQWQQTWNEFTTRFFTIHSKIRELCARLTDEARVMGTLADIKRQLQLCETKDNRAVLQNFQRLRQQRAVLDQWLEHLQELSASIAEFQEQVVIETPDTSTFNATIADEKAVLDHISQVNSEWVNVTLALKTTGDKARKIVSNWSQWLASAEWTRHANVVKRQYDELIERFNKEGLKDPALYGQKVQERQVLEKRLKDLQGCRDEIKKLKEQAGRLLVDIVAHRRILTAKRQQFLGTVLANNTYVRMEVIPYGDSEAAFVSFRELIGRTDERFDKDIYDEAEQSGILACLYSSAGKNHVIDWSGQSTAQRPMLVASFEQRLSELKKAILTNPKSLEQRGWVENHLVRLSQTPDFAEKLAVWFPEDLIRVSYSSPSLSEFRRLDKASPGQKTAAILAFALSHGEDPIILDQPEDDLDNHLIYDLVVRQIRENKRRRQVVIVTHNANIVVNGDSELVLALTSKGGQTVMEAQGGLQEATVRDKICEIMEGGRDAFERRYERILGGVYHV